MIRIDLDIEMPESCSVCPFLVYCDDCEGHENYCPIIRDHVGYNVDSDVIDGRPITPSRKRKRDCPMIDIPQGQWIDEFTGQKNLYWCKFRNKTNCDFCAFHSDCEIHWEGDDE